MMNYYNTGVTVELRELVDSGVKIWDFDYPVPRSEIEYNGKKCKVDFDKATFEQKIIDHYYFRQIGQETVGRWLHYFRTRIREIMPYYVQLYEFDAKFRNIEDPLESYNLIEEYNEATAGNGTVSNNSSTESQTNADSTKKFSNTPQGSISNLDSYMTEATVDNAGASDNATAQSTGTSESEGTKNYTLSRRGNIGVQPLGGEVQNIRDALINIDQQIIDELKDLFLLVY